MAGGSAGGVTCCLAVRLTAYEVGTRVGSLGCPAIRSAAKAVANRSQLRRTQHQKERRSKVRVLVYIFDFRESIAAAVY